jgi:hypothetical protein
MSRGAIPDAAFACVTDIGGRPFKLLRHHTINVRDGNEHDTVEPALLSMALRMIDQVPVEEKQREEIRVHLQSHASALRQEMDERSAEETVNAQTGGKDGNFTITDPRHDDTMQPEESDTISNKEDGDAKAQLVQPGAGAGSPIVKPGTDRKNEGDLSSPGAEVGDHDVQSEQDNAPPTDVEVKTGTGTPAHPPIISVGPPQTERPPVENKDGGEVVVGNPGDVEKGKKSVAGPQKPIKGKPEKKMKAQDKGKEPKGKPGADTETEKDQEPDTDVEKKSKSGPGKGKKPPKADGDKAVEINGPNKKKR